MKDFLSNVWVKRAVSVFNVAYFAVITLLTYATFLYDLEFAAAYADRCGLLFDGQVISEGEPHAFFAGNRFYTTAANKISKGFIDGAITNKDVIKCLKK